MGFGKKLKQLKADAGIVKAIISEGKKLRWTPNKIACEILERLKQREAYQRLNDGQKLRAQAIVHEECLQKDSWKAKDLVGLARKIEKRLKKEFPT